jgi:stress response protein SCP2
MDGKTKHTAFIPGIIAKSGEKWILKAYEKLTNGMRWMEVLSSIQKLLVDDKLIPPIEEEKAFPKPFRSIKGEEIVITSNITKLLCGLGWIGNEDLDLAVLMFRYKEFVDHIDPVRHNKSKDGSVFHKGDSKIGKGTDDEKIYVDLSAISRRVNILFFLVTVFNSGGGGGFAKVKDAHVRLVDATNFKEINDPDKEITRFTLSRSCGNRSAQIMCKLWRVGPSKWNVIAMGEPSTGLFYEHLIPKVQPFLDEAPQNRTFQVTIHSAKNLPADILPYFRVRFDRDSVKTKQLKKPKQKFKEVIIISGEATAMDIGIFHKKLGKDKFFGQIFVPCEKDFKKKSFKLEDRGKKKEKVVSGAELIISLENITGSPAALQTQEKDKKKK